MITSTNNINWWNQLNAIQFACPCYLHTFQDGDFSWVSYLSESGGPSEASGIISTCHFNDITSTTAGGHWTIRSDQDDFLFGLVPEDDLQNYITAPMGIWNAESRLIAPGLATNKNETLFLAPGLVLDAGVEYTISVTLRTSRICEGQGDCTAPGHQAELLLGVRDDTPANNNHRGFPAEGLVGENTILTESAFASAVNAAVTDPDCCTGLGGTEFATNGELVTVSGTFTPSPNNLIRYIGIKDSSNALGADEPNSAFTIFNVTVTAGTVYPPLPLTFNQPNITATITADDGTSSGAIDITGVSDADYLYCWGDHYLSQANTPDRTGLDAGWYALKAVNISTNYHLPIELFHVPFFKAGNLASPNNVFTEEIFVTKGNKMANMIRHGMDSSFLDLIKIDIIKYLWDKDDTDCLTDARKANFEKVLLNAFNTCTPPIVSQFPELSGTFINSDEIANEEIEEWAAAGALLWNGGTAGLPAIGERECCIGKIDYVYPAYVFHKGNIWRSTSINSNTKTEPGSLLGQGNWEKAKKKKGVSGIQSAQYLEFQRKKSIFELEGIKEVSGRYDEYFATYRGMKGNYLELENREIVTPENTGNMNYII